MTYHFLSNNKTNPYAHIPISISDEYTKPDNDSIEYVCNYCHCSLIKMSEEGEYYCNRCSISQYPDVEAVRSKSKITTPRGLNLKPCLSYLADANPAPKDIEPGAFKALKAKGIKITRYEERDGSGRPIKKSRWP
jgi:hypothetical protein